MPTLTFTNSYILTRKCLGVFRNLAHFKLSKGKKIKEVIQKSFNNKNPLRAKGFF